MPRMEEISFRENKDWPANPILKQTVRMWGNGRVLVRRSCPTFITQTQADDIVRIRYGGVDEREDDIDQASKGGWVVGKMASTKPRKRGGWGVGIT